MCVEACPTTALSFVAEDSTGYDKMRRNAILAAGIEEGIA
jgi:Fe-S-cluster-containing hydrogenase component 2